MAQVCYGRNSYGDGPEGTVCEIIGASENDEAMMIAAPELFRELTCLRGEIASELSEIGYTEAEILERLRSADAAISKAKGETP